MAPIDEINNITTKIPPQSVFITLFKVNGLFPNMSFERSKSPNKKFASIPEIIITGTNMIGLFEKNVITSILFFTKKVHLFVVTTGN